MTRAADAALRSSVLQARRWYWQRLSAMVLALCVVVHLALMIVAVRGGLSAGEILSRNAVAADSADQYAPVEPETLNAAIMAEACHL